MALIELDGSRTVSVTDSGLSGERLFLCDWPERFGVGPRIGDPFPDRVGLYCSEVRYEPFGQTQSTGGREKCKLIATYTTRDESRGEEAQQDGTVIDESIEFAGEMLTRAGGMWKDCEEEVEVEDIGGTWYPRLEYTVEMVAFNINDWIKKIRKATGKVNATTWRGGQKEKWLFEGASARSFTDSEGVKKWRITFRFIFRENSWNEGWHGKHDGGATFEEVLVLPKEYVPQPGVQPPKSAYTDKLYETTNFQALLPDTK